MSEALETARPGSRLIPAPLLAAALRASAGTIFDPAMPPASAGLRDQPVQFTLHENGFVSLQTSSRLTIGDTLTSLGIAFTPHDDLYPSASSVLSPGAHVYLNRADSVQLTVGGQATIAYTHADTVQGLLDGAGVKLEDQDQVTPTLNTPVLDGMQVNVTTVRDTVDATDDPIDYNTVYQYDPTAPDGQQTVVQTGAAGNVHKEYKVHLVNGVEASRELASQTEQPPTDEIVSIGTYVAPTPAPEPAWVPAASLAGLNCARTLMMYATWYTAASAGGNGITATGTQVRKGIVAVDPRVIPLGTRLYIPGYGYAVAADTGGGIIGNMIDLGYGPNDVYDWRSGWADICVLN